MKLFITDDNPIQRKVMREKLAKEDRTIIEFSSGPEMLMSIDDAPDLILLDIEMPEMNGIAACRAWREQAGEKAQIIFVSSHNSLEMRLSAYDAGGNDYIIKPVNLEELKIKIEVIEANIRQQQSLAEQAQSATQMAFTALSTIGEMGITQQFMQASFNAGTVDDLIRAVIEALRGYGLKGLIEVRLSTVSHQYSSEEAQVTQMEKSLLGHAAGMGRIFQMSDRLVINYPTITVLMSQLPVYDPDRVGRLRDHLAILVEGANTRLKALEIEQINTAKTIGISQVLARLLDVLDRIQCNQAQNQNRMAQINNELLSKLIEEFIPLGLTEHQESKLINVAKQAHTELAGLQDLDDSVREQLYIVTEELNKLMGIA